MSTPLDPIYCRKCKKQVANSHDFCGHCGWDQTKSFALAEIEAQELESQAMRQQYEIQRAEQAALDAESRKQAIYNHATGQGVCPQCKSPNVKEYTYKEGGSSSGQAVAGCLGCFFSPLAWIAIPFLQGKKKKAFECQYCSNRWGL
jgi:ribosomal protein L37AE/L43A